MEKSEIITMRSDMYVALLFAWCSGLMGGMTLVYTLTGEAHASARIALSVLVVMLAVFAVMNVRRAIKRLQQEIV